MNPLKEPIRILSDIHLGHPASYIVEPAQLAPLFAGAGTVVFNGDTVELRYPGQEHLARQRAQEIAALCRQAGAEAVFVNGNHDPTLGEVNHLDLAGGGVLVMHGDLLFHDLSPWSTKAEEIAAAHSRELAQLDPMDLIDFEKRLSAAKRAALSIQMKIPTKNRSRFSWARTVVNELWPPHRPLLILKTWIETPGKAALLARLFRPRASVIIIGHIHLRGIHRRRERTVINTGSFLPWSGRCAVDVENRQAKVRLIEEIVGERGRTFRCGDVFRTVAAHPVSL